MTLTKLSLKDLCYYLNFDETTWNKNKDMLGYISGEKYEDFFYRKHGFKHTEQDIISKNFNSRIYLRVRELEEANENKSKQIKSLEIKIQNMEKQLIKKVKDYISVSGLILNTYK